MSESLKRKAKLVQVPLDKMRVREEISQRKFDPNWANKIAASFTLEDFGAPYVNHAGEWFWIIDGQHRVAALKQWLGEWKGQKVECWAYQNLTERDEADLFDRLNTVKAVSAYDKYRVRLTAGREMETNIDAIVRIRKLKVSRQKGGGAIACPATLGKVYRRGAECLARDLEIAYGSFGDSGLDSDVIDGLGLLVSRYDGRLDDQRAIRTLGSTRGGVNSLRNRAAVLRQQTGAQRSHCIAAAAVEAYNRGRGGKKLAGWWKAEA